MHNKKRAQQIKGLENMNKELIEFYEILKEIYRDVYEALKRKGCDKKGCYTCENFWKDDEGSWAFVGECPAAGTILTPTTIDRFFGIYY